MRGIVATRNVKRKKQNNNTLLLNHKFWLEELFTCDEVEITSKRGFTKVEKRYTFIGSKFHPHNLCKIDRANMVSCMTFNETKKYYLEYVVEAKRLIFIESKFQIHMRGFEITGNTWEEVDSLGVTRHFETDWINSVFVNANESNAAKYKGKHELGLEYDKVNVRRVSSNDTHILINPMKYFPELEGILPDDIDLLLRTTHNKLGKSLKDTVENTIPGMKYHLVKVPKYYNNLVKFGLVEIVADPKQKGVKIFNNADTKIVTTALGKVFITALLPTKVRSHVWSLLPTFEAYELLKIS